MYKNIVLSGGNTLFSGFPQRLAKELGLLAPNKEINILSPPDRMYSAWLGGAIFSSQNENIKKWITKEEYDEHGPGIVHRKC